VERTHTYNNGEQKVENEHENNDEVNDDEHLKLCCGIPLYRKLSKHHLHPVPVSPWAWTGANGAGTQVVAAVKIRDSHAHLKFSTHGSHEG
jgi:hypothetical protein